MRKPDDRRFELMLLDIYQKLNERWRAMTLEVMRGFLARQALDDIGKDKAA